MLVKHFFPLRVGLRAQMRFHQVQFFLLSKWLLSDREQEVPANMKLDQAKEENWIHA